MMHSPKCACSRCILNVQAHLGLYYVAHFMIMRKVIHIFVYIGPTGYTGKTNMETIRNCYQVIAGMNNKITGRPNEALDLCIKRFLG